MLVHKGGQINNVQLITGVRTAEMSQLQNCSVMCTKNASENENQRTNGPVNAHLISWPSKAQNIQNLENIW